MSTTYINIGSTPPDETCFPAGHPKAGRETNIYLKQLQREFPSGHFGIKWFPHDFGRYCEVVAYFEEGPVETSEMDAAYAAEGSCLPHWDEISAPLIAALRAE